MKTHGMKMRKKVTRMDAQTITDSMVPSGKVDEIIQRALSEGRTSLLEFESDKLARLYGMPVAKAYLATTDKEAAGAAARLGFPIAMKIVSPDVIHKSDIGGVKLNISNISEARRSFKEIKRNAKRAKRDADIRGVYLQRMAPKGQEFVVGGIRDAQFGPTVMFGLGGIYVELYKDVAFRLAPVTDDEALDMMKEIKAAPLLTGFRGSKPLDLKSTARVIKTVGKMMSDIQQIDSIDINPLLIYPSSVLAVDVRVILRKEQNSTAPSSNNASH
jgi:acetate---CoA ligase (ADP-forming) subunit beta